MNTINLKTNKSTEGNKEKEWVAIGKKFKADELTVLQEDEEDIDGDSIDADFGYHLTWKTEEDDIHVYGDKTNKTAIKVDEPPYKKASIKKLEQALACLKEIEANRKKYY